jgi:hypothetical protein
MGDLKRGDQRWEVYLESKPDGEAPGSAPVRGRLHFIAPGRHRVTAWIFLEGEEGELYERFTDFSPVELWNFVAALSDEVR